MLGSDGLLAAGRHVVATAVFKATFVDAFPNSATRAPLYQRWLRHRFAVLSLVPIQSQWIDGSFVTDKEDPGDIDLVTVMSAVDVNALSPVDQSMLVSLMSGKSTKAAWGMDSYAITTVPPMDPAQAAVQQAMDRWHDEWSRVRGRPGAQKGYLEVAP